MRIMCLGDSITSGFGVPRADAWTSIVAKELDVDIVNCGVPGDTTGGMLARMPFLMARHKPSVVAVLGGANDVFFSGGCKDAQANLAAMCHQISAAGVLPVVCSPLPVVAAEARREWSRLVDFEKAQKTLGEYTEWIRLFSSTFSILLVDFWRYFGAPVWRRPESEKLYSDGIHPNKAGHILMAEIFGRRMQDILTSPIEAQ